MTITLYGMGASRSFRCLWALTEAKLEHTFIAVEMGSTETNGTESEQYLALNPQGKVPSLTHGDFVLTESAAILNYIATLSEHEFIPTNAQARAKYDELAFFVLTELEQPLWTTGKHKFAIPEEHRVADIFTTAQWEFEKALNAFDKLTSLNEFAFGDSFSFADILVAQTLNWADSFKFELPSSYLEYRDRMYAREAVVGAIARYS